MEEIIKNALSTSSKLSNSKKVDEEEIKISVIGIGGGGNNTINRLTRLGIKGATLIAANADKQHLNTLDDGIIKLLIGKSVTHGLGCGGFPSVGEKCAEVDRKLIENSISGSHLVFICAGMGGGTGTGAAPVVAKIAKDMGAIVVAMVSYPFSLERARTIKAEEGIAKLRESSDSVIILDNNRLVQIVPNLPMTQAFLVADEILAKAIDGLVFTITQPSLINIDFADVKSVMGQGDVGMIAVGSGKGNNKVEEAVRSVKSNRLLDVDFAGSKGALIHIAGGNDLTLGDAIRAGELITEEMDPQASVKWGARLVPDYDGKIEITAIVTGVSSAQITGKAHLKNVPAKSSSFSDIEVIG